MVCFSACHVDIHLLLTVPEEMADPDVPEVCECYELTVLLLPTLPSTLLTVRAVRSVNQFNLKIFQILISY